jgi:hypothetical protein
MHIGFYAASKQRGTRFCRTEAVLRWRKLIRRAMGVNKPKLSSSDDSSSFRILQEESLANDIGFMS